MGGRTWVWAVSFLFPITDVLWAALCSQVQRVALMVVDGGPHAGFPIHNNLNDLATVCPVENPLVVVESVSGPQMSGF